MAFKLEDGRKLTAECPRFMRAHCMCSPEPTCFDKKGEKITSMGPSRGRKPRIIHYGRLPGSMTYAGRGELMMNCPRCGSPAVKVSPIHLGGEVEYGCGGKMQSGFWLARCPRANATQKPSMQRNYRPAL